MGVGAGALVGSESSCVACSAFTENRNIIILIIVVSTLPAGCKSAVTRRGCLLLILCIDHAKYQLISNFRQADFILIWVML